MIRNTVSVSVLIQVTIARSLVQVNKSACVLFCLGSLEAVCEEVEAVASA